MTTEQRDARHLVRDKESAGKGWDHGGADSSGLDTNNPPPPPPPLTVGRSPPPPPLEGGFCPRGGGGLGMRPRCDPVVGISGPGVGPPVHGMWEKRLRPGAEEEQELCLLWLWDCSAFSAGVELEGTEMQVGRRGTLLGQSSARL